MAQAVINEIDKEIKLYEDNQKFDFWGYERHIINTECFLTHDENIFEIDGIEKLYWFDLEENWFLKKQSAIDFVNKNKWYRQSDIKRVLFFWVVFPEKWRCVKKKKFSPTYIGFKIMDYRG